MGLTFNFEKERVVVRAKRERAWKLWLDTRALLRRRRISGELLRVWIGHVNFHFLLARPLLSCLSACYAFAAKHRHHRYPMWPAVRKELKIILGLIFTVGRNLSSPANPEVHAGDSSDRGYGLMSTFAESSHVEAELRVREKWRFIVSNEAVLNPNGVGLRRSLRMWMMTPSRAALRQQAWEREQSMASNCKTKQMGPMRAPSLGRIQADYKT